MSDGNTMLPAPHRTFPPPTAGGREAGPTDLQSMTTLTQWRRDSEICSQNAAAEYWHCVVSGVAREYFLRPSGQRQIIDVLLPGDFFGFAAGGRYRFAVRAGVCDAVVARYPRQRLEAIAESDSLVGRLMRDQLAKTIDRLHDQLLVLGRIGATEKVANYLVRMSRRLPHRRPHQIVLPVSRYDIADALGISVETVSRAITELKSKGWISLGGPRQLSVRDWQTLEEVRESDDTASRCSAQRRASN